MLKVWFRMKGRERKKRRQVFASVLYVCVGFFYVVLFSVFGLILVCFMLLLFVCVCVFSCLPSYLPIFQWSFCALSYVRLCVFVLCGMR